MLPVSATWDDRGDALNPVDGEFLSLQATPLIGLEGGSAGLSFGGDLRLYRPFGGDDQHVWAVRGQLSSVTGFEIEEVPPSILFFSGGGGTVRGQPFQSLAVEDGDDRTGGLLFAGLSAEVRVAATDTIGVVGFADFGLIGDEAFGGEIESHAGAGLGLRYNTCLLYTSDAADE